MLLSIFSASLMFCLVLLLFCHLSKCLTLWPIDSVCRFLCPSAWVSLLKLLCVGQCEFPLIWKTWFQHLFHAAFLEMNSLDFLSSYTLHFILKVILVECRTCVDLLFSIFQFFKFYYRSVCFWWKVFMFLCLPVYTVFFPLMVLSAFVFGFHTGWLCVIHFSLYEFMSLWICIDVFH